ncbi:DUF7504 family protein [Halalkalicoccus subterraneus]|uniref:DUF7504 family protein n=1 Tax=Halalkalicoccus subterraneus TaxID=2675002 RepID=UPI0013CEAC1C|nr:hypothetical protein [Halalkalicoccus subterraneus]
MEDHHSAGVESRASGSHNALVYGSATTPIGEAERALGAVESCDETNVLLVAHGCDHDRFRRLWHERIGDRPANFGTVCIADTSSPGNDAEVEPVSRRGRDIAITVRSANQLVELGIAISLYLEDWTTGRTLVCVHPLETLLARNDTETVFRFLHVLTGRVTGTNATGRFSLDPTAVDERTARTLEPMFDSISSVESDDPVRGPSPDVVFDVLRASRRRYVLHFLSDRESTTVSALVAWLARHESESETNRIELSLRHTHLPKLENTGLIAVEGSRIEKRPAVSALDPYLDLVSGTDLDE